MTLCRPVSSSTPHQQNVHTPVMIAQMSMLRRQDLRTGGGAGQGRGLMADMASPPSATSPELSPAASFRSLVHGAVAKGGVQSRGTDEGSAGRELSATNTMSRMQQHVLLAGSASSWPSQYHLAQSLQSVKR